jgi:outer membrane protein assembly factor BamB
MRNMNLILLLFSLPFLSCDKTTYKIPEETTLITPKIIWRSMLGPARFDQINTRIGLYKNKIIAAYQSDLPTGYAEGYYVFDKNTGSLLKDIGPVYSFLLNYEVDMIGNYHIANLQKSFRTIDLEDYSVNYFKTREEIGFDMYANITVYGDEVYMKYSGDNYSVPCYNYGFYKSSIKDKFMKWEKVMEGTLEKKPKCRSTRTGNPSFTTNKKGDKLMLYSVEQTGGGAPNDILISEFVGYNLTTKKIQWSTPFEIKQERFAVTQTNPVFHNGIAVMSSSHAIHAFDIETGKLMWENNDINEFFPRHDQISMNGYFFITDCCNKMYQLDMMTGKLLKSFKIGGNASQLVVYKNVLYFTAGRELFAVDPETFSIKWTFKTPNYNCSNCTLGGVTPVIDPETNLMYITDRREMFCLELPE